MFALDVEKMTVEPGFVVETKLFLKEGTFNWNVDIACHIFQHRDGH